VVVRSAHLPQLSLPDAGLTDSGADGRWAESLLAGDSLAAPHLMPVGAANILRRAALAGDISADVASLAHTDLLDLRVEFFPTALRCTGMGAPGERDVLMLRRGRPAGPGPGVQALVSQPGVS